MLQDKYSYLFQEYNIWMYLVQKLWEMLCNPNIYIHKNIFQYLLYL